MKHLLVGLLIALSACCSPDADAAVGTSGVDTWYLRPLGACANNGDGLAYGCAASAGATGAFIDIPNIIWTTTTGVDDGDTLYVCGLHQKELRVIGGGSANNHIVVRGDCPGDPGTIDSSVLQSLTADALRIEGPSYVKVMNFTMLKGSRHGVLVFETAASTELHISGVTVDQRSAFTTTNPCHGIAFMGNATGTYTNSSIRNNTILGTKNICFNIFNDGIHLERVVSNVFVTDNIIMNTKGGVDTSGASTGNYVIARNKIYNIRGNALRNEGSLGCLAGLSFIGNLIVNPGEWGIDIEDMANSLIANNTVYMVKDDPTSASAPYGALIMQDSGFSCPQNGNTYLNNVFVANYADGVATNYNHTRATFEALNTWNGNFLYQSGLNTYLIKFLSDSSNHVTITNFATWKSAHPKDLNQSPIFVGISACASESSLQGCLLSDFRLSAASPLRWAGDLSRSCVDTRGRICNSPPDIGAYQMTSGDPAITRLPRN